MYHYRYDVISADIDYHISKHPQQDLKDRGYKWTKSEPFPIADCWIFRFEKELIDPPKYLTRISDAFSFSDEKHNSNKIGG